MTAELIFTKNKYEIWVDNTYVTDIPRKKGENDNDYKNRATVEYGSYLESLRQLKSGNSKKTIRTDII
jgi:hypothetical protein